METPIDQTRWYQRMLAAFIFFTRLPFWRLAQPPAECYKSVTEFWPLTGWLTGGLMALVLYGGSFLLPWPVVVLLAIAVRMLLTGALHEDGLADFFDGFGGGGSDRQRVLAIMKDSHIGTYGVLGLLSYVLLLAAALYSMTPLLAALAVVVGDPFSRMVSGQLVQMMPYARTEQEAKNRTVYRKASLSAGIGLAVQGLLPMAVVACYLWPLRFDPMPLLLVPPLVMYALYRFISHRLHGYTGDCCGAVCLLTELSFYLTLLMLL